MSEKNKPLKICDTTIMPGERVTLAFPTPELYTCIPMYIPIHVIHGKMEGPCVLICAAINGDEINGISITQNLLKHSALKSIQGTLIIIPVVNVLGLAVRSRNLPYQRDLAQSFPGSQTGSLASRLTHFLHKEILSLATHIVDIHTGEPHYSKLPQLATNIDNPELLELAKAFSAPVIKHTDSKEGLLWMNAHENKNVLIYEAGEALRLDPLAIRYGQQGIIKFLRHLGMLKPATKPQKTRPSLVLHDSMWIHAPGSGLSKTLKKLGQVVKKGERVGTIDDPFGTKQTFDILSPQDGVIISYNTYPLLNEGDHLFEIAFSKQADLSVVQEWETE